MLRSEFAAKLEMTIGYFFIRGVTYVCVWMYIHSQLVQEKRSLMDLICRRKKNWIGQILSGETLLRELIEGRMIGKRPRGRKLLGILNEFLKEASYAELPKEKGRKQERMDSMEAKNLPNGRTLTTTGV